MASKDLCFEDSSFPCSGWKQPCQLQEEVLADEISGNRLSLLSGKQYHVLQGNEYVFPAFKRTLASRTQFCKAEQTLQLRSKKENSSRLDSDHFHMMSA